MAKKEVKKVVVKKAVVTAPKKEVKVKAPKKAKSTVELISFSVKATIPVMTFGNIQPEIVVKAKTIEEAQAFALPVIEALFDQYVEAPRDGSKKVSFSKANVTVTEKQVTPAPVTSQPTSPVGATATATAPKPAEVKNIAQPEEKKETFDESLDRMTDEENAAKVKSAAYEKGEKAITAALSNAALDLIENQIRDSVKLTPEEKPMLFTVLLKRRKEVK